jgi:hypothetical protein
MLSALLLVAGARSILGYSQPGIPPQCLAGYECIFSRFPTDSGLSAQYTWDLRPLCAGAGSEYIAQRDPSCVNDPITGLCPSRCYDCTADKTARIRFNVCGTVSGPVAPVKEENCPGGAGNCPNGVGSAQEIPIPASRGVALQVRAALCARMPTRLAFLLL